mmetsp:Transcript_38744/g.101250  ORF Transcript_38744/g.101250 Transcript_38744/m.101250 type:complete len:262 (-) Transcript_38744:267-1052(-)
MSFSMSFRTALTNSVTSGRTVLNAVNPVRSPQVYIDWSIPFCSHVDICLKNRVAAFLAKLKYFLSLVASYLRRIARHAAKDHAVLCFFICVKKNPSNSVANRSPSRGQTSGKMACADANASHTMPLEWKAWGVVGQALFGNNITIPTKRLRPLWIRVCFRDSVGAAAASLTTADRAAACSIGVECHFSGGCEYPLDTTASVSKPLRRSSDLAFMSSNSCPSTNAFSTDTKSLLKLVSPRQTPSPMTPAAPSSCNVQYVIMS